MKTRLLKKAVFVQGYGTYTNEMLVIVGKMQKKYLFKLLKKLRVKFEFSKWVLESFADWQESISTKNKGLFCWNDKVQGTVLILRTPEDTWEYWEILMHELHHAVQKIAKDKAFLEEAENQAYLQEHLFHSIRRILQGVDKI